MGVPGVTQTRGELIVERGYWIHCVGHETNSEQTMCITCEQDNAFLSMIPDMVNWSTLWERTIVRQQKSLNLL